MGEYKFHYDVSKTYAPAQTSTEEVRSYIAEKFAFPCRKDIVRRSAHARYTMERKNTYKYEKCPYSKKCGGCDYQGMTYEAQLNKKEKQVRSLLGQFGKIHPILGMEDPLHYRNKVHAVFGRDKKNAPISGVYQKGTHLIVPVDSCMLEDAAADRIIVSIRNLLKSFKIRIYDEDTEYGLLRHVLIKRAFATGQIMVVLVTASPIFPSRSNFVKALRKLHPEITTIVQNINSRGTSMVLGSRDVVLYGKGYIEDVLCGCTFCISAQSFYQVNPRQTEKLYNKAMELAKLTGRETVFDAYCGVGTIGLIAAKHAGRVIGAELNPDAVKDAIRNAKRNGASNISFYCEDAGNFMLQMIDEKERPDVVFMDPPRIGSDEKFLRCLTKLAPKRVVYISCNPTTLARDLDYLTKHGYRMDEAWPVDMFPFSKHVETVVSLSHKTGQQNQRKSEVHRGYAHPKLQNTKEARQPHSQTSHRSDSPSISAGSRERPQR